MNDTPSRRLDTHKLAHLIQHWIEHNEGHRRSYLEWRDKLAGQDLPQTVAALERIAELSAEANEALAKATAELAALEESESELPKKKGRFPSAHQHEHW